MAQPITDPGPMPPELAIEVAPLSDAVLERLDQAFGEAEDDGIGPEQWEKLYTGADPFQDETAPAAAHLVPAEARGWRIDGTGSAEWAMRHVAAIDTELATLTQQRDEWRDRIDAWFSHRAGTLERRRGFFATHLQLYALERRETDPKAKTLTLPAGVVRTIEHKPSVAVEDEPAVIQWAKRQGREVLTDVAPPIPRKVHVRPLRDHCSIVEIIDRARIVLSDGEVILWDRDGWTPTPEPEWAHQLLRVAGPSCPGVGDGWPSPEEAEAIVGLVETIEAHLEVHGPDGQPVPGARIEPGSVSAKVVPAL